MATVVGRRIFTLYLMSDSYLGLDQQFDLHLEVIDSVVGQSAQADEKGE